MAGVEQGNVSNEEFTEEIARYECVYHRNSKDFKDKNKKANCWNKIGEKFNLSSEEAEVKFRSIRTAYGRYLKRLKTVSSKRRNKFACSKVSSSTSAMLFAAIFLTLPLTEMYATVGSAIIYDCLRLYGNNSLCDRLRSAIVCVLRSSAIIWKPAFMERAHVRFSFTI